MKLFINEKLFSIHHRFYVLNEQGENVYEIASEVLTIGDKTTVSDMAGNQIAYIEQRLLHLMPNYDIYINGAVACSIQKKFRLFKNDYELSNGYTIKGNFMALNFTISDENGNVIGELSRKFISIGDKYTIDIYDEKKLPIVLSIIVAITNDVNRAQSSNS